MNIKPYILPTLTVIIVGIFIYFSFSVFKKSSKQVSLQMMHDDIQMLKEIFDRIHTTCKIIDFDYQKNPINFLNVEEFTGSEVGPMNLSYPDNWEGPYVEDNPTMQALEYQVVKTKQGYFITPGDGVQLPNGQVVGKDIPLYENTDMKKVIKDDLMFDGKALAAPIVTDPDRSEEMLDTLLRPNGTMVKIDYGKQHVAPA